MASNNEIQKVKAEIKMLEKKLSFLEELSKTKTPCEEAFKEFYGAYPITDITDTSWDSDGWIYFEAGYNAAYEEKVSEKPEVREWDVVRESMNRCKEHPDKNPLDWVKPQTPEQVNTFAPKELEELVKEGVVSSTTKQQNLTDLIYDWWEDVFTTHSDWDMETSIENLVDQIQLWLPKEQSAAGSQNVYVECTVEGFNDCLGKIKNKLR
jgi:hypothetical protein